jgi:hypothetical protein
MTLFKMFSVLLVLITFTKCTNEFPSRIVLEGKIGNHKAEISLIQKGAKFEGEFNYIDIIKPIINLDGILNDTELILHEFDDRDNLSGIFQGEFDFKSYKGYWLPPNKKQKIKFEFGEKKDSKGRAKEEKFFKLEPKELISYFFKVDSFLDEKKANYQEKDGWYIVEFNEIKYLDDKKQALVFFSNYYTDGNGNIEECHACAGFVSIGRFERKGNLWEIISFTKDCHCGSASWGQTNIPILEKVGETYFLLGSSGYVGQGYYVGGASYYEIDEFKSVLSSSEEDNGAAVFNEEERYSYTSNIELKMSNEKIKAIISYKGTDFNEKKNKIEDITRQEIYFYNKDMKQFIKE